MRSLIAALICSLLLACSPAPINSADLAQNTVVKAVQAHPDHFNELNFDRIRKFVCWAGDGAQRYTGTGWIIAKNTAITAAHVVDRHCIDNATQLPVRAYYVDWDNDFALVYLDTGPVTDVIKYSCEGFIADERYSSYGYAGGTRLRETRLIFSGKYMGKDGKMKMAPKVVVPSIHLAMLRGDIYHGMSGGPILNEVGEAVGINSTSDEQHGGNSRELKDTILCGAARHNPADRRNQPFASIPDAVYEK